MVEKDIKLLEAILFASGEPVSETDLKEKIKSKEKIKQYLIEVKEFYEKRGIN